MSERTTLGEEPRDNKCPKCGAALNDENTGYGLAFGDGPGFYQWCADEQCNWFFKELDRDE
jgi:hypothetical protein